MKPSDYVTGVEEASRLLDWDPKSVRDCLRAGVLTIGTAIHTGGSERAYKYYIDKQALDKVVRGEKDLFRA